jgi:hypothetical protein
MPDTSILDSTKKILGIAPDYTAFDQDIITHINSVFSTLSQLGVGPEGGFFIEDNVPVWGDFTVTDPNLNAVKTYIYLRVRLIFDPPATSFHTTAIQEQIRELEWRLTTYREATRWVDPLPLPVDDEDLIILDGGTP